jgi:methylenetetrahydrofolate--tRNA-(uracil-5-)-methyltransferase
VVQLRAENQERSAYNLVGFQTRMTHGAQARVLRTISGLERAEVLRFGSVHRNTFVNAPEALDETMQLRKAHGVFVAGQLSGVEGYVESAAGGLLCAIMLAQHLSGCEVLPPPRTTALGGLLSHLRRGDGIYQPSNITWAHLAPMADTRKKKRERYAAMADRALADLTPWIDQIRVPA